ncbi:MAG: hypothetical protein GY749_13855 [Desulfobacteraceae bacterium]|nr:hypothetical protein [Desulfobacteraceae bacterium]
MSIFPVRAYGVILGFGFSASVECPCQVKIPVIKASGNPFSGFRVMVGNGISLEL